MSATLPDEHIDTSDIPEIKSLAGGLPYQTYKMLLHEALERDASARQRARRK
jgi:hypothetical protein